MQVAGALAKAAESFMDGVNFDLEVPLQVRLCGLQLCHPAPVFTTAADMMDFRGHGHACDPAPALVSADYLRIWQMLHAADRKQCTCLCMFLECCSSPSALHDRAGRLRRGPGIHGAGDGDCGCFPCRQPWNSGLLAHGCVSQLHCCYVCACCVCSAAGVLVSLGSVLRPCS